MKVVCFLAHKNDDVAQDDKTFLLDPSWDMFFIFLLPLHKISALKKYIMLRGRLLLHFLTLCGRGWKSEMAYKNI